MNEHVWDILKAIIFATMIGIIKWFDCKTYDADEFRLIFYILMGSAVVNKLFKFIEKKK